ncbi:MAG: hypothetical protein EOP00_31315, partial [Pedobacter sp.]
VSAAGLLAKQGFSTLILESHTHIGGCASFFKRKNFTFDAGATTLSGVLDHQPLGKLFNQLGLKPNLKKLDPGMIIHIGNKKITRYADKTQWIKESSEKFHTNQQAFWDEIYALESQSWDLISDNYRLPPKDLVDLIHLAKPSNLKHLKLIPGLVQPVTKLLKKYKLDKNKEFVDFIDEQLLISTQNISSQAPYLTSSIGLAYPSETYYPYGGITKPLDLVLNYSKAKGNGIKFKEKVTLIERKKDYYQVTTEKGKTYQAKGIISNIPIWNMAQIVSDPDLKTYFKEQAQSFTSSWGAFTLYFAIKNNFPIDTAYYQIHSTEKLPYASSKSFFVSFSLDDDFEKAPEGWRTVTISTHVKVSEWENLSPDEYDQRKHALESAILKDFNQYFPKSGVDEKLYLNSGTPSTFEFFTNRHRGYVGGIPHSIKKSVLQLTPNTTPFENFYMVG